ncbi:MAG: hypothetical protein IKO47_12995 [Ruminococcus sp.]|nr:hypothetical protein [Ruminococcus sp.]
MKKHISFIIAAVICLSSAFSATSCSSQKSSSSEKPAAAEITSENNTVNAIPATSETTTTTTTTAPLMPPMSQPVEAFDSVKNGGVAYKLFSGPDNTVMIYYSDWTKRSCVIFDPIHDKITRTLEFDNTDYEPIGIFNDGTVAAYYNDGNNVKIRCYAEGRNEPEVFQLDNIDANNFYVDAENDCIYSTSLGDTALTRIDRKGNTSKLFGDKGLSLMTNVNIDSRSFVAYEASEDTITGNVKGLYSLDDGSLLSVLNSDCSDSGLIPGGSFDLKSADYTDPYGYYIEMYGPQNSGFKKSYHLSDEAVSSYTLVGDEDSRYIMMIRYDMAVRKGTIKDICFVDTEKGAVSTAIDLTSGEYDTTSSVNGIYCPELRRWIISLNYFIEDRETTALLMTDPSLLTYDIALEEGGNTNEVFTPAKSGDKYKEVRAYADQIEKEFGIKILIGDEVKDAEYGIEYVFESIEDYDYNDPETELLDLKDFREVLKMYPEGFFEHFKAPNGKCGLRVSFLHDLKTDMYSSFSAGGIAYTTGGWYNIALNHNAFGYSSTSFHHEMLHTVESLVKKKYPLDDEKWNALNPAGFSYTQDFDGYSQNNTYRTDYFSYDKDADKSLPYFIGSYSIVTPMEDRATLIEELFEWKEDDESFTHFHQNEMNFYKDYPHLKAKLDFLADWTKQEFGYVYWEETLKNFKANPKQPWE